MHHQCSLFALIAHFSPQNLLTCHLIYQWVYYNLFQPVMHLSGKTVVDDKLRRRWDQAQTPFERLKATGKLSAGQQQRLQALYEQTNPRQLREEIYRGLAQLWEQSTASATEVA